MSEPEREPRRSLARWVQPPRSDADLDTQWAAIRARRATRSRPGARSLAWWLGGGATIALTIALAAGLVAVLAPGPRSEPVVPVAGATISAVPGAVIESGPVPVTIRLAEGSDIVLDPSTRLEAIAAPGIEVRFALRRGRATFEVAPSPARRFVVSSGGVEVVAVGARFTVAHDAGRVAVQVERALVEVHTSRAVHRLGDGETWSGDATVAGGEVAAGGAASQPQTTERDLAIE